MVRQWQPIRTRLMVLAVAGLSVCVAGCGATSSAPQGAAPSSVQGTTSPSAGASSAVAQAIKPMTQVNEQSGQGYFSDPYPIHLAASDAGSIPQTFSGTSDKTISCPGDIKAGCFHAQPSTVAVGLPVARQAAASGAKLTSAENHNIYQDNSGAWQMAVTYRVRSSKYPNAASWNVILHAHPVTVPAHGIPISWVADSLLAGSLTHPTGADYDGKYLENDGKIYLIHSEKLPGKFALVAQLMKSWTQPAATPPVLLLSPGDYNSEDYTPGNGKFRLIETGNVTEIDGKYVLAYSSGAYDQPDYKIGIAWSDTFLPAAGQQYRKVTMTDTSGVWGKPGQPEVRYLLQSQKQDWPNYAGQRVTAPGVPSIVQDGNQWYLFFAGYLPSDVPKQPGTTLYQGSARRPFYAALTVDIPAGASVATTPESDLANWINVDTGN